MVVDKLEEFYIEELARKYRIEPRKVKYILSKYGSMFNFGINVLRGTLDEEDREMFKKNLNFYVDIQNGENGQCNGLLEAVLPQDLKGRFLIYDSSKLLEMLGDRRELVKEYYGIPNGVMQTYSSLGSRYNESSSAINGKVRRELDKIKKDVKFIMPEMFGKGLIFIWNPDLDIPESVLDFKAGDKQRFLQIIIQICDSSLIFYPDKEYQKQPESIEPEQFRILIQELMLIIDRRHPNNSFRKPNSVASLNISIQSIRELMLKGIDIDDDIDCLFELSEDFLEELANKADRNEIEDILRKRYEDAAKKGISFEFVNPSKTQVSAWNSYDYYMFLKGENVKPSKKDDISFDDYMALLNNEPENLTLKYGLNILEIIAGSYENYCILRRNGIRTISDFEGKDLVKIFNGNEETITSIQAKLQEIKDFERKIKVKLQENRADVLDRMSKEIGPLNVMDQRLFKEMMAKKIITVSDFLSFFEKGGNIERLGIDSAFKILDGLRERGIIIGSRLPQSKESIISRLTSYKQRLMTTLEKMEGEVQSTEQSVRELEQILERISLQSAEQACGVKLFGQDVSLGFFGDALGRIVDQQPHHFICSVSMEQNEIACRTAFRKRHFHQMLGRKVILTQDVFQGTELDDMVGLMDGHVNQDFVRTVCIVGYLHPHFRGDRGGPFQELAIEFGFFLENHIEVFLIFYKALWIDLHCPSLIGHFLENRQVLLELLDVVNAIFCRVIGHEDWRLVFQGHSFLYGFCNCIATARKAEHQAKKKEQEKKFFHNEPPF